MLTDKATDKVLGAWIMGPEAGKIKLAVLEGTQTRAYHYAAMMAYRVKHPLCFARDLCIVLYVSFVCGWLLS